MLLSQKDKVLNYITQAFQSPEEFIRFFIDNNHTIIAILTKDYHITVGDLIKSFGGKNA